jgi:hypothetical protein
MLEQDVGRSAPRQQQPEPGTQFEDHPSFSDDDLGEEDVPTVVLYVIAGLLILSFSLYLLIGGGHSHFH